MSILIILALPAMAVAAFFLLARIREWEWVEDARARLFGEVSTWFQMGGIAATLIGSLPIPPETMLSLWNSLPASVSRQIPDGIMVIAGLVLFVLSWLSKYVKQPKLRARIEAEKP